MPVTITDIISYKRLVAAANDQIWCEDLNMAAGTMVELPASKDDIDTSDQLNMCEAYQKVFIVNGTNFKVADFANTKLTCSALTNPPAHGDILTQDQGSDDYAYMIVDFVNAAKTAVYGKAYYGGDATAFNTTNTVASNNATATMDATFTPTGVNIKLTHAVLTTAHAADDELTQATSGATMIVEYTDTTKTHTWGRVTSGTFTTTYQVTGDGSGTAFTPTAIDITPPLWYDWTVYPDIVLSVDKYGQDAGATKSFGTMPTKAYLICNYRGRLVTSGDPEHSHQWYMTRQGMPWDFAYIANDAGTPVAGGNADAGEVGDIVRSLISYKDDYLVFGCATTLWFIAGDPAEGGSLNELSLTAGILGAKAYIWDKNDWLYVVGTNGILAVPPGFGPPKNLTEESYPNFIDDMAYNSATHRVTMEYDRQQHSLLIAKTTLADGTHTGWWYDLRANGLFPETYPEECGPYSLFYYDANDPDNRTLLAGCKDGRIRFFDESKASDDIGNTDEAIDSYVTFGPIKLGGESKEGVLHSLAIETAGDVGGSEEDSDAVTYSVFVDRAADGVTKKLVNNTSPNVTGTVSTPGRPRGNMGKRRVRGAYVGIRLGNNTAGETWGLEKVVINGKEKGRVK